jgi:hypothetical protein
MKPALSLNGSPARLLPLDAQVPTGVETATFSLG